MEVGCPMLLEDNLFPCQSWGKKTRSRRRRRRKKTRKRRRRRRGQKAERKETLFIQAQKIFLILVCMLIMWCILHQNISPQALLA